MRQRTFKDSLKFIFWWLSTFGYGAWPYKFLYILWYPNREYVFFKFLSAYQLEITFKLRITAVSTSPLRVGTWSGPHLFSTGSQHLTPYEIICVWSMFQRLCSLRVLYTIWLTLPSCLLFTRVLLGALMGGI